MALRWGIPILWSLTVAVHPAAPERQGSAGEPAVLDSSRLERTMRLDFFHTGSATEELFSLDRIVVEPLPWPGNPSRKLDTTNLGQYFFEIVDSATNRVLYSRGFSSVFGEWVTTWEAAEMHRTFHESLRFPAPAGQFQVILKKRDPRNFFREVWMLSVDPEDRGIEMPGPVNPGLVSEIQVAGGTAEKIDFLLLGDGYAEGETGKCEEDARRMTEFLFAEEPFQSHRSDFNVRVICPVSRDSGVSRPSEGLYRDTALQTTYDFFGSERYLMTRRNREFRELASRAPYEFVEILVNSRTYGGGGIFGLYATVAVDNDRAPYVFVHEFGHHFAGLADEYYVSPVAYESRDRVVEPWEKNVTALEDVSRLKWRGELTEGVPLPTPWRKREYEEQMRAIAAARRKLREEQKPEHVMESLFKKQSAWETTFFASEDFAGQVGAFEGAMYEPKGYFRPELDCIMFSRNPVPFCRVCRRALQEVIDLYTGR